ncbi:MAG: SAM-dependent methyltransferase [Pseudomonadota bacterium]|nr:SAM-dependent methyltransferase [Pseudomonadota bacterium]
MAAPPRPPLWAVGLLAAAGLAYEVLLTRLFAIIQWHHFAYMVISLALLGYGVSGTFLTLLGERAQRRFTGFFAANAALFGVTALAGFLLVQRLPFNAQEIAWNPRQYGYLLLMYLLLAVPFFCVANAIGLALMGYGGWIQRIYAFDLVGAGIGAAGVVGLLFMVFPLPALTLLAVLGLLAAAAAVWECGGGVSRAAALLGLGLLAAIIAVGGGAQLRPSEFKDLSQTLQVVGAEKLLERSSPLGLVTVVRNDQVPFRHAPGLSLASPVVPPAQLALFGDGAPLGVITRFAGDRQPLVYLDYLTSALAYHLLPQPDGARVLVLGAGGGAEVLQALYHGVGAIDAVELNPQVVELVRTQFAGFAGHLYRLPQVTVHIGEARGFGAGADGRYDLIQVALLDAFASSTAGLYALSESYLYTVEAFQEYLGRLKPEGVLTVTRWLRLPPRDSVKLLATAAAALERLGVADPGRRLLLIRGWNTATLVVKNAALTAADIAALHAFCRQRSFDVAWHPGITADQANRYNVLEQPYLYAAAQAILGPQRQAFFQNYKFDVRPATDDRPYFFNFFKWRSLPELLALRAGGGLGQVEWGYLVLVATLAQALLTGVVLILLPLGVVRRAVAADRGLRWRVPGFFLAIGLAFLFLEIAFIQRFVLFLSHPLYAVAVVLCAFLVFAGLGSGWSVRLERRRRPVAWAVAGIAVLGLLYLALLPGLFDLAIAWPEPVKVLLAVALVAPLAFFMGMPFPLGLAQTAARAPRLVAWAWAINGCASVVSAVLATLLAVEAGFTAVVAAAVGLYLLAALAAPGAGSGR